MNFLRKTIVIAFIGGIVVGVPMALLFQRTRSLTVVLYVSIVAGVLAGLSLGLWKRYSPKKAVK